MGWVGFCFFFAFVFVTMEQNRYFLYRMMNEKEGGVFPPPVAMEVLNPVISLLLH